MTVARPYTGRAVHPSESALRAPSASPEPFRDPTMSPDNPWQHLDIGTIRSSLMGSNKTNRPSPQLQTLPRTPFISHFRAFFYFYVTGIGFSIESKAVMATNRTLIPEHQKASNTSGTKQCYTLQTWTLHRLTSTTAATSTANPLNRAFFELNILIYF